MNNKRKAKIKLLKTLEYPKLFSLYKISENDVMIFDENGISFKHHPEITKSNILSVSKYIPNGLNFEPWIKIQYMEEQEKKDIYITSRRLLIFGSILGDNEKLERKLKLLYLSNK